MLLYEYKALGWQRPTRPEFNSWQQHPQLDQQKQLEVFVGGRPVRDHVVVTALATPPGWSGQRCTAEWLESNMVVSYCLIEPLRMRLVCTTQTEARSCGLCFHYCVNHA